MFFQVPLPVYMSPVPSVSQDCPVQVHLFAAAKVKHRETEFTQKVQTKCKLGVILFLGFSVDPQNITN